MTRWIPLIVVAVAAVPSARAADRPLLISLAGFPALPPSGSWADPDGRPDPASRWSLFEGGRPPGRDGRGLSDVLTRRDAAKAADDARARADVRFARYLRTLASARARQGDLRGAIELEELASALCEDDQARTELRQSLAIHRNEQERASHRTPIWATIDGLPPGYGR